MATNSEVLITIKSYLAEAYTKSETSIVPKKADLTFGNSVKKMEHAVILYIDMRKSRNILFDSTDFWSIKIHKAFLRAVTHCLEKREGHLRSFNGDGMLSFFIDENAASRAVKAAMEISGFVREINELLKGHDKKPIDFGVGIAQGGVMVAKSGKAGDDQTKQDLIWIGVSVYVAVELSEFGSNPYHIWISKNVRDTIEKQNYLSVVKNNDGKSMWEKESKFLKSTQEYNEARTTTWYFKAT